MNNVYTLNTLRYQPARLMELILTAKYPDEVRFYENCLAEVNKDIDNIVKNEAISSKNSDNSCIS